MAFYKENQINPASSCLPIVAQIPIFIGLFFVLRDFEDEIFPAYPAGEGRPRVAGLVNITENTKVGWGPLLDRRVRGQPAHLDVPDVDDDAAGAARADADPADRVHPLRAQLPRRADALLADDEPVDDRAGPDHAPADAEARAAAEEELADAAQERGAGAAAVRGEAGRRRSRAPAGAAARAKVKRKKGGARR